MNLATAATKIAHSAIEFLAVKHEVSTDAVIDALENGHVKIRAQYEKLVLAAIDKAAEMVETGEIVVTA